jgi:hypothetical protein
VTTDAPGDPSHLLDGLSFRMVSSTASTVNAASPTHFDYHQAGALVWGEYEGDTVSAGRFVGRVTGHRVEVSFAHAVVDGGSVVTGSAVSVIEARDDGLLYLIEDFEKDGRMHRSVCVQVA